ncbi:ImmA/IrrE family metallo-endopeptidase [Bacillus swezeyi]|uniref:ImmA/IrrE family metallo-endopeptidase n=1 Tax=Bacillus swezeyi TaxID=1925020 RepID=UPI002E20E6DF|nr:ImmA/IrrE family metallo-endopeptidase [Bacillus swezeyi]
MYKYSTLEEEIKDIYSSIGILKPTTGLWDLELIAEKLKIIVHYKAKGSEAVRVLGMPCIIIDSRLSKKKKWEDFCHELCHVIHHVGIQANLPDLFIELQENHANAFMYHFAVPSFMLNRVKLPQIKSEAVNLISDLFCVSHSFATKRLEMYIRKLHSFRYQAFLVQRCKEKERLIYANN